MEISKLQDIYKGKLVFVVGAGPSLHHIRETTMSKLVDHPIIAVNSAISKFQDYKCKDLFFLSDDWASSCWDYYQNLLPKMDCTYLLYHKMLKNKCSNLNKEKVVLFNHKIWYDSRLKKYYPNGLVLTKEISKPIIGARTSAASAVHFAYAFGASHVVLLGCDCCYSEEKYRYYWQYDGEKKCKPLTSIPLQLSPSERMDGHWVDNHAKDFLKYWDQLAEQTKKQNINIINASGGILNSFPKMKLEEVLEKYA